MRTSSETCQCLWCILAVVQERDADKGREINIGREARCPLEWESGERDVIDETLTVVCT